jgi:hypothetical protein
MGAIPSAIDTQHRLEERQVERALASTQELSRRRSRVRVPVAFTVGRNLPQQQGNMQVRLGRPSAARRTDRGRAATTTWRKVAALRGAQCIDASLKVAQADALTARTSVPRPASKSLFVPPTSARYSVTVRRAFTRDAAASEPSRGTAAWSPNAGAEEWQPTRSLARERGRGLVSRLSPPHRASHRAGLAGHSNPASPE